MLTSSNMEVYLLCFVFQETIFDEFALAHIIGWWGKAILIRNQPLLWVLSIGFELMEVRVDLINTIWFFSHRFYCFGMSSVFFTNQSILASSAYFPSHVAKFQRVLVGQYYSGHHDLQLVW